MHKVTQHCYQKHFKIFQLFRSHRYIRKFHHRFFYKWHLWNFGINRRPYMFFPANFWPHKNHRMLLTAYGMFTARNPKENLDLVLAGTIENHEKKLEEDVRKMGLENRIHFIGLEKQHKMAAVWRGCSFLIFPLLCETSFIPLFEAMFFNKPIMCSRIPAFTKVVNDAALYFDPRNPEDIVSSIEQILRKSKLRSNLIYRGQQRITDLRLNVPRKKLRDKFRFLSNGLQNYSNSIIGIYEDKWTHPEVIVAFKAGPKKRLIEFHFEAPSYLPSSTLKLYLKTTEGPIQEHSLKRGEDVLIHQKLPKGPGYLMVWTFPVFRPSDMMNGSSDHRLLGCLCHGCWLISSQQERIPLFFQAGNFDENS